MNKTRMGKRVASLLLSLVMMLSLLPTAAYATMADDVDTQGAIVSENGTGVSDDDNSGGDTGDQQVVGGSANGGTADDTTGAKGDADTTGAEGGNDTTGAENGTVTYVAYIGETGYETLDAAITDARDGDTVEVAEGSYTLNGSLIYTGKAITVKAANGANVIFDMSSAVTLGGAKITFENVTFNYTNADYTGLQHTDTVVYNNCTINGKMFLYANSETFNGCHFVQTSEDYNVWTYGAKKVAFNNCTFDCVGKAVNVYIEKGNASDDAKTVEVNSCKVNSDKAGKAFLNIKNSTQAYDVTLSGTNTVTGLEANGTTGSALYQVETTEVTETAGNPVTVKEKADDGTVTTVYEVKQPSANVAKVGGTEYATLEAAIAALGGSSYTLELLDESAWDAATPVYWAAGTQSGYAATLADALTAAYKANGDITIVCRPGADVGKLTHGHVADDITIYGNNAYISSGECDLEVDTFMYSRETGKQVTTGGAYLDKGITVTAYELDNLGVWGERHTDHKVTVNLTDCDTVNGITVQRVYISGTTGMNDITLTGCDFGTKATSVYSNADGAVVIDNCSFTGAQVPVNFNHKAGGTQTVTVKNSKFANCGDNGDWKQFAAPVRFVNSGSGTMTTTVDTCTFNGTVGGNGDILLGDGRVGQSSNDVKLTVANTEANVQAQQPGYYAKDGTTDESKLGTKTVAADKTLTTSVNELVSGETYVAAVGEKTFASLQAAIDAAGRNATVRLLADTRENVTISTNYLTLDLNGHTLNGGTVKGKPALTVTARVTVKDSSAAQTGTIMREDTAETSGVSSHYVIDVQDGWLTFESGIVKNNSGNDSGKGASLVRVGDDSVAKYPGLTIKGGTFTQDNFIVIKVDRGDLFLNGGTLNSANSYAIEDWHRATIKGGTVNGAVAAWTYSGGLNSDLTISGGTVNGNVLAVNYGDAEGKVAKVSITGGAVNGELGAYVYNSGSTAADPTKATIAVTGGTFSSDPTKYVVENSAITKNDDGTFGVAKAYLAKVGDTSYYTMDEAFKAQTASGKAIVLLRDYTTGSPFHSGTVARTVDLNGHTWTCTGTDANSAAFEINNPNAKLTVKNGKVVSSQLVGLIPSAMGGTIKYDNSTLVFDGVEMTTTAHSGIETNGNNTNDTVTLVNSTLNVPNGFGIYFPSSGTLTIENSKINAKTMGVQVCSGSLNITGDQTAITVSGDGITKTGNDGAIEDGAAISIVERTGYKGLSEIKVDGGTFKANGTNAAVKAYKWENKTESDFTQAAKVFVSGGTFSSAVDKSLCADGFIPTKNENGTYGVKEGKYVAEIGSQGYESLQAAIDAAKSGATVKLLADTRENVTIAKKLTLDLNGFTLNGGTVKGTPALKVDNCSVTVKDSSAEQTGTIKREDTADNSGVSSHYVIDIQGKNGFLKFEGGNVVNNSGNTAGKGASLIRLGNDSVSGWPTLTIKGGTFTQDNFIAIKVDRGTLHLLGGTVNSANSFAIENWNNAYIKGGTVNGTVSTWVYSTGAAFSKLEISGGTVNGNVASVNYDNAADKQARVYVTGGTVTGTLGTYTYNNGLVAMDETAKATIEVTGGTFSKDPTKYVVEDSAITPNGDGTYGVAKTYLAKIGDTEYYTMDEAFHAAVASGETLTLLRDYTTGSSQNSGSNSFTIDLNGFTWTYTGKDVDCAAFEINYSDVTLTVKNGKVVSSQLAGLIPSAMSGTITYDNSGLVFENVEMTANGHSGIEANGSNTNDTVTLRNSTLNVPNGYGIYFPSSGTLTIDNSKINAKTMGVQVCSGSLNVTGADTAITVSGDGIEKTGNDGAIEDGAAISIVERTGYKGLSEIKVSGGTFTANGTNDAVKAYKWENQTASGFTQDDKVSVSGGTFSSAVDKSLCAEGFIPTDNGNGTYGVKEGKYVAEIGSQGYESLQEAINAAQDGQTVTLLADATEDVVINKSITLDLGGKTLTNTNAGKATISVTGGTVTVKNGNVVGGTGYYNIEVTKNSGADLTLTDVTATAGNTGSSMIDNWGTLTITSGTYTGGMNTVKSEEGSVLNISGGTFTCDFGQNYKYTAVILVYGTTTITGGEFIQKTTNTSSHAQVVATGVEEGYSAITTITGGKFTNEKLSGIFHGLGKATSDNFEVSGGTFNKYVSDSYMAEGLIPVKQSDGTYGVKEGKFVAEVGSIGYETFDEAIAAANASANSKTVYLRENITVDHQLVINNVNSKAITLDLQKHTLTSTYAINTAIKNGSYALVNNTPLTIKNGTFAAGQARAIGALERLTLNGATVTQQLTGGHACVAFCADGKSYTIKNSTIEGAYAVCSFANNATINITGSKLTGTGNTLYHNGTNYGLKLTVKDTTITSSGSCGVYISGSTSAQSNAANQNGAGKYQQATFTGCTISGALNGVEVKYTDLTLDGCTVSTTAKDASYKQDNNGPAGSGFAVVSTDNAMNNVTPKPEGTIIIKGTGKYTGPVGLGSLKSVKETYADFADETIKISGGTFTTEIPAAYCADGFIPTQNEDGTYGVKVGQYVAEVGSTKYETLAEAVAAAQDGQTVRLLADVEQNTQLTINKNITLDLNGKTIRNTVDIWSDNANAILSITNGANVTITGNGTIAAKENDCYTINVVNGDLTIENGTFVGNISVVQVQKGSLTINGGAFSLLQKMTDGKGENRYLINCIDSEFTSGNASVAISGGTFVGFDPNVSPEQEVDGKAPSFAAPGAGITKNEDGSFTAAAGMTAQILDKDGNSVKAYNTLAEAVAAAQDGQTVRLLADVAEDVVISKSITLDLGGKTLTNTNAGKATISVTSGTVIVKNGNVVGGTSYYNIEVKKDANLTLTDVTATAGNNDSSMIDNYGTLTITSGTYTGGLDTVKNESSAKLNITGGTFTLTKGTSKGFTGVVFNYGELTISGGTFIQSDKSAPYGQAQVIHTDKSGSAAPSTVITGGTFKNLSSKTTAWVVREMNAAAGATKVSGGAFNKAVKDYYCAEGFIPTSTKDADGNYGVKVGKYVAEVGSKKYETLADAIRLAAKGKTITLLADVEQNTQLTINKSITLDLNGKTIKNTVDIWGKDTNAILSITNGAKVTITGNGTIDAKENDCYTINVVKGDLTIENGTFYGNVSVVQVQEGTLSVKGGTFDLHQKWEGSSKYLFNCIDNAYVDGSANVAISGGTFVGFDPNVSPEQKVDGKTPSFAAPGAGITKNEDGSFTAAAGMTAQILDKDGNSVKAYRTLAEAVAAAEDGQTVRLLANVTLDAQIATGKAITIDLNKMTVTGSFVTNGEVTIQNGTIDVPDSQTNFAYGKLTLADVDITGKAVSSSLLSVNYNGNVTIDKDSTIVVDSEEQTYPAVFIKGQDDGGKTYAPELNIYGTVQSGKKMPAIQGNGTDRGVSHINVYDGAVVKSEKLAMYLPQPCEVNISGGLVEGYCGIGIKSGTLNITGGTVRGVANDNVIGDQYSQTNGISYDGSAIMIDSYIGYAGQVQINISGNAVVESKYSTAIREIGNDKSQTNLVGLDITGGTVLGAKDTDAVLVRDVTAKDVNISGGEFSSIVKKEYCAPGFTPVTTANSEGRYGVEIGKFTVKVTSRTTASDSPVANVAGGGSDITYAEGITVTASAISGYNFVGWFVNEYTGTAYSTDLTCEVKPTDDWTMIAVYEPISGGKFWLTVTASEFTVNGGAVQDSYLYEQFAVGASVTVNFTGSENFLYWVNASNKVVSTDKSYTFIMGSETTLKAVYGKARQNQATVVFISHSDQIISSKAYTTNDTIQFPVPPIKMGCTFTGWSMTEAEIRAAMANNSGIIQVRALYTEPSIACKVTVVYPEGTDNQVVNAVVGKAIDVTAKDIEGKTFSYWTDNDGNILGYTKTLKLAPSGDMTVKAVYDQAAEAKPVITMSEVSATTANESYVVTFMATRAVPNGYKVVKQGILWSRDAVCGEDGAAAYMQFDSNGKLPDGVRAYIGNNLDLNGVTRYDITTKYNDRTFYGRGYMVLESDAGELLYIYTDTIASGSYDSLTK